MFGSKYVAGMDTAAIAKALRADIKAAQKSGAISPSTKISVRTSRYSGGSSIDVQVTHTHFLVMRREHVEANELHPHEFRPNDERHTPKAAAVLALLEDMGNAYRRDDSDTMTDYFSCNFSLHVRFSSELERLEQEMMVAALRARLSTSKEGAL